jgi:hypothetical protein
MEENNMIWATLAPTEYDQKKKPSSKIVIDGPTALTVFTYIKYSWFKKIMYKLFFGFRFEKIEEDQNARGDKEI